MKATVPATNIFWYKDAIARRGNARRRGRIAQAEAVMKEDQIIVGGQAVIEGVMMRAPHSYAVAVRLPGGEIISKSERLPVLSQQYPMLRLPVLRGAGVLIHSMILGIKALNFSANAIFHETADEAAAAGPRVEVQSATLTAATSTVATAAAPAAVAQTKTVVAEKKTSNAAAAGSMIFAVIFNIFLFIVLPLVLTNMLFVYLGGGTIDAHSASGTWYANAWAWTKAALHPVRP